MDEPLTASQSASQHELGGGVGVVQIHGSTGNVSTTVHAQYSFTVEGLVLSATVRTVCSCSTQSIYLPFPEGPAGVPIWN